MELVHRFGRFEVRPLQRQLLVDSKEAKLGARAFDVLLTLIERSDRLVTKHELLDAVWPGLVVEENNLVVQIGTLRKLLGPSTIATIPGRGYRFTARIEDETARPAATGSVHDAPRATPALCAPTNLPLHLAPLYGRSDGVAAIKHELDGHRLVTLVGPGGIGKSRLAQAVAHGLIERWPDGVWMVELSGLFDPALVPNAVAQALGIKLAGQGTALDELIGALAKQTLLLTLDNCEHLLDAAGALVHAAMLGAPNVKVLATSQEPLRLPDEQQFRVMPLAIPPKPVVTGAREFGAVALFEARARAVDPYFSLNDESLGLVIDICGRLDGLPLAIELAAVRVPKLGLHAVRDKLDERFKLLTGGSRAALRRHQTLRAALEWSHNLLNPQEQAVFRRLGVFAGGFTLEMLPPVAEDARLDEWAVIDHLGALVDKSMVVAEAGDPPRYRLLESPRAFALEQLAAAGETAATLKRHALAVCDFLATVDDAFLDGELRSDQHTALVWPELDNVRTAHAWATGDAGDGQVAIALATRASAVEDFGLDCVQWLLPLRKQVEDGIDAVLAARYWLAISGPAMFNLFPRPVQVEAAHRAVRLYQSLGQTRRVYFCLLLVARHQIELNDDEAASEAIERARRLLRPEWPARLRVRLVRLDSYAARRAGRMLEALQLFREVARVCVQAGDWGPEIGARNVLADLLWEIGPIEEAAREVCSLAEQLRARPASDTDTALVFSNVVGILSEMDRVEEASTAARESLPVMRRAKQYFLDVFVHLLWRREQFESAALLLGASEAVNADHQAPRQPNERRLIGQARLGLGAALTPDAFARLLAEGAALGEVELHAVVADALSQPLAIPR